MIAKNILRIGFRAYSTASSITKYEVLELQPGASVKEVKKQFKVLSKKYHPDLNNHLSDEEKKLNSEKFVNIVSAYDTLKDSKKKKQYDMELQSGGNGDGGTRIFQSRARRNSEWHNKYYGEAKYYSKANGSYSSSGLNSKRHRVYFNEGDGGSGGYQDSSAFSGRHMNYGDRYDVPHFNYKEHLSKHLKFEQRILNKSLSESDREKIIKQLSKEGDSSEIDDELLTKHLMRQAKRTEEDRATGRASSYSFASQNSNQNQHSTYMYQGPQRGESDGTAFKAFAFLGAGSSLYYLWTLL
ncbi:hypothetical protein CLIB1423_14S01970 [[Candida] railenensis]|uniref:J domain-containing protein n=1 Tax=[Candida] railenensis TaxID=45579 RepID=A0A9P0QSG3_9ASCO|nr:hypothetical protein CLIB1423_14S01970 [[Candida] railenensis]